MNAKNFFLIYSKLEFDRNLQFFSIARMYLLIYKVLSEYISGFFFSHTHLLGIFRSKYSFDLLFYRIEKNFVAEKKTQTSTATYFYFHFR